MGVIVTKEDFRINVRPLLKKDGKKIALCHGVFDLVHPGHIQHFEQAAAMADVLVVSVTASKFVRKGPGRPYFGDEQRLKFLSMITCIDYVILSEGYTVDDIVECVEPDIYVKGAEYADEKADITQNIRPERKLVERHGGRIAFTGGEVFSSTKLLNRGLSALSTEVIDFMQDFKGKFLFKDIIEFADKAKDLKALVIGDIIIDRYTYCTIQGLMSKNMAYSVRAHESEDYLGGAVAVARHLKSFSNDVTLLSVRGNEVDLKKLFESEACEGIKLDVVESDEVPTIIKHRYISPDERREEYSKVFVATNIPKNPKIDERSFSIIRSKLLKELRNYDVVFLCDFGHGLINRELMEVIQENSRFIVLNCQTNSSNYGLNNITKYRKADVVSLDQKELRLAYPELAGDEDKALKKLCEDLKLKQGWLTRGSEGAWGYSNGKKVICPAFTLKVSDTIGAGDAFYAVSGIFAAAGAPVEVGTLMGNVAGALAANIVGNKSAVERVDVLKFSGTLMNV